MTKPVFAAAFAAASFLAAPAFAENGYGYGYNGQRHGERSHHYDYDGYDARYGAYNRIGCPPGSIVQSFPNSNGQRCELPEGGYKY